MRERQFLQGGGHSHLACGEPNLGSEFWLCKRHKDFLFHAGFFHAGSEKYKPRMNSWLLIGSA
jgi:hypothetical protein